MSHRTIIFAKNLMTLRTLHEMTQQELADKIHVTRQTISTGNLEPENRIYIVLADYAIYLILLQHRCYMEMF